MIKVGDTVRFRLKKPWERTLFLNGRVESVGFFPIYVVAVPVDYIQTKVRPTRYLVKAAEVEVIK